VAPPAGSTLLGLERDRDMGRDRDWDRDRDRTFCCGPSRGIGLSAVTPYRRIGIFFESMLLPLKGQSTKNVFMVGNTTQGL
jgi:hypothetical protein